MRADVLVIEDNEINQIFFEQILSEAGLHRRIVRATRPPPKLPGARSARLLR